MRILIINGPNLNLLGKREPQTYGTVSFDDFFNELKKKYTGVHFTYFQSNVEGELINCLHEAGFKSKTGTPDGIVFNPGGYSHTSVAIADAIAGIETDVVEVHISNVHAREDFRQTLITGSKSLGVISGFGLQSYIMAIDFLIHKKRK